MTSDNPVVFVVDDDARVRDALSSLLASAGREVAVFASATEFLQADKPDVPACLVLDLELPDIHGLDLQKELAEREAPPIVFITGHGDVPSSVKAMKAGAVEFLSKPFGDEELLVAIDAAIALDRAARLKRSERMELARRYERLTPREREVLTFVVGWVREQADGRCARDQRNHHRRSSWPDHAQDGRPIPRRARPVRRQARDPASRERLNKPIVAIRARGCVPCSRMEKVRPDASVPSRRRNRGRRSSCSRIGSERARIRRIRSRHLRIGGNVSVGRRAVDRVVRHRGRASAWDGRDGTAAADSKGTASAAGYSHHGP